MSVLQQVWIDLSDISDDALLEELISRATRNEYKKSFRKTAVDYIKNYFSDNLTVIDFSDMTIANKGKIDLLLENIHNISESDLELIIKK